MGKETEGNMQLKGTIQSNRRWTLHLLHDILALLAEERKLQRTTIVLRTGLHSEDHLQDLDRHLNYLFRKGLIVQEDGAYEITGPGQDILGKTRELLSRMGTHS
jgi:predicted transcriptional regulator